MRQQIDETGNNAARSRPKQTKVEAIQRRGMRRGMRQGEMQQGAMRRRSIQWRAMRRGAIMQRQWLDAKILATKSNWWMIVVEFRFSGKKTMWGKTPPTVRSHHRAAIRLLFCLLSRLCPSSFVTYDFDRTYQNT